MCRKKKRRQRKKETQQASLSVCVCDGMDFFTLVVEKSWLLCYPAASMGSVASVATSLNVVGWSCSWRPRERLVSIDGSSIQQPHIKERAPPFLHPFSFFFFHFTPAHRSSSRRFRRRFLQLLNVITCFFFCTITFGLFQPKSWTDCDGKKMCRSTGWWKRNGVDKYLTCLFLFFCVWKLKFKKNERNRMRQCVASKAGRDYITTGSNATGFSLARLCLPSLFLFSGVS